MKSYQNFHWEWFHGRMCETILSWHSNGLTVATSILICTTDASNQRWHRKLKWRFPMFVTSFSSISYCNNLRLISNMLFEHRHPFYTFRHPWFHSQAYPHSFLLQATWHKQSLLQKNDHRNKRTLTFVALLKLSLRTSLVGIQLWMKFNALK